MKQSLKIHIQHSNFKYLILLLCSLFIATSASWAQALPSISPTLYPTPASSADFLDNLDTKYISNYSTETHTWSSTLGLGFDIVGWSYSEAAGGGGKIAVGTHPLSSPLSPFTGVATTASIDLPNAVDIRVGYMEPYIVAAYYDMATHQYLFSFFNWGPAFGTTITPALGSPIILPTTGVPSGYERISMDINQDRNQVVMTYSEGGDIYGVGLRLFGSIFSTPSSTPFSFCSRTGVAIGANTNPDIAFNRSPSGVDNVFYTFYNSAVGTEFVFSTEFNTIVTGLSSPFAYYGAETLPSGVNYVNFDCPDHFSFAHWAYTYSDGNKIYLRADTSISPSPLPYTFIINDGSLPGFPADISMYANKAPTLAYKLNLGRDEIFVAWASDAGAYLSPPSLATPYSDTYLGMTVAVNKVASGPKSKSGTNYAFIDNDPTAHYMTSKPMIAIDRNTLKTHRFVSYTTDNATTGYELKHKNVDFFNDLYRTTEPSATILTADVSLKLYPNPFADALTLKIPHELQKESWSIYISDLLGRQMASYKGTEPSLFVQEASRKLSSGQYIIKLQSSSTEPKVVNIVKQ